MRAIFICLILLTSLFAQVQESEEVDESEDPQESTYLDQLIAGMFQQPLNDSLRNNSSRKDDGQLILRQRMQYSPSSQGWRILNKGRWKQSWGNLVFLTEQDPGEMKLNDHSILTFLSHNVVGFSDLLIGDFNISWGGGFLLNQQSSRFSMNPSSLRRKAQLKIHPHYSSREIQYYRGIAGTWVRNKYEISAFISNRKAQGSMTDGAFKEDSDGIHQVGKTFAMRSLKSFGIAAVYHLWDMQFYVGMLDDKEAPHPDYETGIVYVHGNHNLEAFTNYDGSGRGRFYMTWFYKSKWASTSFQFRRYNAMEPTPSATFPAFMGGSASNEEGISSRIHINTGRRTRLLYSLDYSWPWEMNSLTDISSIRQHKFQLKKWSRLREWRLDWSYTWEGPISQSGSWEEKYTYEKTTKMGLSLVDKINPHIEYRLNLKAVISDQGKSGLIQQRFLGKFDNHGVGMGYVKYLVPNPGLRLSIYESSVAESFSFYTAFDEGERWFMYIRYGATESVNVEMKLAQTIPDSPLISAKELDFSTQLSIVF